MALLASALCVAGLWGTVGCAIGFILNAFPARDRFDGLRALKWGSALLLCFILWMTGMANA